MNLANEYLQVIVSAALIIPFLIICLRCCGLRSFSKMTGFDFAITIATGSILASPIVNSSVSVGKGALAIAVIFIIQFILSFFRKNVEAFKHLVDNKPVFIFKDGNFIESNMRINRVTRGDVIAKMREANATDLSTITAIVLESTGDISVLHGDKKVDPMLFEGIQTN